MKTNKEQLIYIVHKEARFGHGVMGTSLDLDEAKLLCELLAEEDHDIHHEYVLYPMQQGEPFVTFYDGGDVRYPIIEGIYWCCKGLTPTTNKEEMRTQIHEAYKTINKQ